MISTLKRIVRSSFHLLGFEIYLIHRAPPHDKIVTRAVGKYDLVMNADHTIADNLRRYPGYSANLPRVVQAMQRKYPGLSLVDIGANIGDGVALVRSATFCPIICVEGEQEYFDLLTRNLRQFPDTFAHHCFLGEDETPQSAIIRKHEGTVRIEQAGATESGGALLETLRLDTLATRHPVEFDPVKVVKIDTDGYDLRILRGARDFIQRRHPALFLEYDREYLDGTGDDGLSTFAQLESWGYDFALFYDNYGRFLLAARLGDREQLRQLDAYIAHKQSPFPFYDLAIFHRDDAAVAQALIALEIERNHRRPAPSEGP